jgi:hypothetical protein
MVNGRPEEGSPIQRLASSELRIRRAVAEDAPQLARLRYEFRGELDPLAETQDAFRSGALVGCRLGWRLGERGTVS